MSAACPKLCCEFNAPPMKWFNVFKCENTTPLNQFGERRKLDFSFNDVLYTFNDPDEYRELPNISYINEQKIFDLLYDKNFRYHHDKLSSILNFTKCRNIHYFSSYLSEMLKDEIGLQGTNIMPSAGLCTILL